MPIHKTTLTGAAGEHYVVFRLLSLGYIAGLAPQGSPNADIIATDVKAKKSIALQVKTLLTKGRDGGWHMKAKHEELVEPNLFYCFVDLSGEPITFIIPSKIVAETISEAHKIWLSSPGRNGRAHKDHNMRRLLPDYSTTLNFNHPFVKNHSQGWMDKYKENWLSLGLELK